MKKKQRKAMISCSPLMTDRSIRFGRSTTENANLASGGGVYVTEDRQQELKCAVALCAVALVKLLAFYLRVNPGQIFNIPG